MYRSRIAKIMKKRSLPRYIVTENSGLSKGTVLRLMKPIDLGKVTLGTLLRIASALKCKVSDLFE
ncbi:MAG: helix-turn-helix transcriptional regulator [Alphaproteobacteria bacterium]|nr:helix-turn-helix transcriptional regulator [Alphaproteobacteria bacterium]